MIPFILLAISFGSFFLAAITILVLAEGELGALVWSLAIVLIVMGTGTLLWALSGIIHQRGWLWARGPVRSVLQRRQTDPSYSTEEAIKDLLRLHQRGFAVKLYREANHSSVEEAEQAVAALEENLYQ